MPSFHKIESDLSNKSSETSLPDSTKGSKDDVKFFWGNVLTQINNCGSKSHIVKGQTTLGKNYGILCWRARWTTVLVNTFSQILFLVLTYVQTEFFLHVCVRNFCFYIYNNVITYKLFVFAEILRYLHYFMNRDKFVPTKYFCVCVSCKI